MKIRMAFVFGLQTLWSIDFTKFYQLKGLEFESKGHTNFYECCDLTKKVYLAARLTYRWVEGQMVWDSLYAQEMNERRSSAAVVPVTRLTWGECMPSRLYVSNANSLKDILLKSFMFFKLLLWILLFPSVPVHVQNASVRVITTLNLCYKL